jgi:hypothetical protein
MTGESESRMGVFVFSNFIAEPVMTERVRHGM